MNILKLKKTVYLTRILPVLLLFLVFSGLRFGGPDDDIYKEINENMDVFGRVYKEIALNYVDEIEPDKFLKAGIDGMLNTLDPYTNFLDESRKDEIELLTTGKYGGIGITIGLKDSAVVITEIMDGYSAQREGLRRGDRILEVDGIAITGKKVFDIRALVKGAPGSSLKMKVQRGGRELDFALTREEINLKNVTYKGVIDDGIGYIKLERFNKNAESDIVDAITDIKSKGELKGLIIDLRDNPGGLLDAAIGILDKIAPRGNLLLTTRGRKIDSEKKYFSNGPPLISPDVPLAVIVNQNTASASEIVAGAVQDLDRGVIVGTKTFGKGLVQVYTPLSYDNQLKITTQKYFTPSGRWIQSKNYFKENNYGVFKPNPYFNQTEFKTLNGRTVYAEGGITPDTIISYAENNELLDIFINQDMYFRFASKYVSENPDGSGFIMNEALVDAFYSFLNQEQIEFSPRAETELSHLKKVIEEKNYSERTKTLLSELESELKSERLKDFEISRPQINRELEREILRKYNRSTKEITDAGLKDDIQLQTALSIIKDKDLYNRFLR